MSRYDESYEERRERQRSEEREYRGDVMYEVWRSNGNPDRIDYDRVGRSHDEGLQVDDAARRELRAQRPPPSEQEQIQEQPPLAWPEEQPPPPESAPSQEADAKEDAKL